MGPWAHRPMGRKGPKGPMGPMGPKGPKGPMVPMGPMGPMGSRLRNSVGVREQTRNAHVYAITWLVFLCLSGQKKQAPVYHIVVYHIIFERSERSKTIWYTTILYAAACFFCPERHKKTSKVIA